MLAKLSIAAALSSLFLATSVDAWVLQSTLSGNNFFSAFNFFTGGDPTHGFVQYVDQGTAQSKNLAYVQNGQVIMKADNSTVTPNGRPSVRITSNAAYNHGLFLLDVEHMPFGCGTWPAYWMVGSNWPNNGEVDIIEGVNKGTQNQMTLHTNAGCTMAGVNRPQTGSILTPNCDVNAAGQGANVGCGVLAPNSNSYGAGFNNIRGGVYALQWTQDGGFQVWFFPRNAIPGDITSNNPNPYSWGNPTADFPFTNCPNTHFVNLQFVFDLTFCGDWAGSVYGSSGCPSSCTDYVANNPSAFNEAYWRINKLQIYQ